VPYPFAMVLSLLALDLAVYLQHLMFHAMPILWRVHRMHHADLDFDVTTGARFHPIEMILSMLIKFAAILLLGPPVLAVLIFEVLLNATAMFNHSNVRIPQSWDRALRWLVVTPDMHRVHHSIDAPECNSNFGFNLPWWDRLFGTYRAQPAAGHEHMIIGIKQFRLQRDLWLDQMLLEMTRAQAEFARRMTFVEGDPAAILIVEFSAETADEARARLDAMERALAGAKMGYTVLRALDFPSQDNIWRVRKAAQGLLQGIKGDSKPITFVEDTAVAPERLAAYIERFQQILGRHQVRAAFYAHASVGCLHVRPLINLKDAGQIDTMRAIAEAVGELVIEFGGAFSAEHGDGMVRGWFLERYFGPAIYQAFKNIKTIFDPRGLMNPGKIVNAPPMTDNLRFGASYQTVPLRTHFDWQRDGGMAANIEMCSGVGACRKTIEGTMCPSYMVTREEEHSTRGRANLLRAAMSGLLPAEELTGRRLHDALDLCLECKGCKAECPANVDMAKLKYEFLARYHEAHGYPLRARLFGNIHALSRAGTRAALLSTWMTQLAPARWVLERIAGVDRRRPLPPFAQQTFDTWWKGRNGASSNGAASGRARVALFADTFMRFNYPEIGRAAVRVFEGLGYEVIVPDVTCCGRPMISKGMLAAARTHAQKNLAALLPLARAGIPIVGCEPSCILTFRDEVPDLFPGPDAEVLAGHTFLVDEFLHRHVQERGWPRPSSGGTVLLHGHCHQKAAVGTRPATSVLKAAGFAVEEVDSGCCGMAGSFGFEREHYDISMAIGERRLLPAVRRVPAETEVVAMGVSCRQQIAHGTGRRAKHLVELLAPG